jgi:formamidopyrimidine-DNA glycosylase
MPELPDLVVYIEHLQTRTAGRVLRKIRVASPFLVRSCDPPIEFCHGKRVLGFRRMGKRIVFCLEENLFLVLHLMLAGRLHWKAAEAGIPAKRGLAALDFDEGTLLMTEAGTKRRASLHLVRGEDSLRTHDPGGLEILESDLARFREVLCRECHTLKRALTDPLLFSGIGNAYSDEILHAARLSPLRRTDQLQDEEIEALFDATRAILLLWTERIRSQAGERFPEKVSAFREGMAVHGRHRLPCPRCGSAIQRIVYAENETNYCATCQTAGKVLADRALSRLLRADWPRTLEDLEARMKR